MSELKKNTITFKNIYYLLLKMIELIDYIKNIN